MTIQYYSSKSSISRYGAGIRVFLVLTIICVVGRMVRAQDAASSPGRPDEVYVQQQIAALQQQLNSSEVEERREAVLKLGWIKRPQSSRIAAAALNDPAEAVRAAATQSVLSMPSDEAAGFLLPVLSDKRPFVRQEAAFALGQTQSRSATPTLINTLRTDPYLNVRAAAAVALGRIVDPEAIDALSAALSGEARGKIRDKSKTEFEFLRRSSAVALGQIGQHGGVPSLVAALSKTDEADDVRREAARALGQIADPSATSALQAVLTDRDPYLSRLAQDALDRINSPKN